MTVHLDTRVKFLYILLRRESGVDIRLDILVKLRLNDHILNVLVKGHLYLLLFNLLFELWSNTSLFVILWDFNLQVVLLTSI